MAKKLNKGIYLTEYKREWYYLLFKNGYYCGFGEMSGGARKPLSERLTEGAFPKGFRDPVSRLVIPGEFV